MHTNRSKSELEQHRDALKNMQAEIAEIMDVVTGGHPA